MSVPHLCRKFKRASGVTVLDYVYQLRLDEASSLLRGSDMPISEIALLAGYPDLSTFNRRFKQACGCTPRRYRAGTRPTA